MTEFGFVTVYLALGAAYATWLNWRYTRTTGQPLRAIDHLIGIGVTILWPMVLVAVAGWVLLGWLIDRLTPTRYP